MVGATGLVSNSSTSANGGPTADCKLLRAVIESARGELVAPSQNQDHNSLLPDIRTCDVRINVNAISFWQTCARVRVSKYSTCNTSVV